MNNTRVYFTSSLFLIFFFLNTPPPPPRPGWSAVFLQFLYLQFLKEIIYELLGIKNNPTKQPQTWKTRSAKIFFLT